MAKQGAQTVQRSLRLLEAVAAGVHSLDDVVEEVGLTRSTTHRLLSTLVQEGYLRRHPESGYQLGPTLIKLGFKAYEQLRLPKVARAHLERLSAQTKETVHLAVLDDQDVMYIDKVAGSRGLQMASRIGARVPVQSTALGKVLVSGLPEQAWSDFFMPDLTRTPNTVSERPAFIRELQKVARQGYAFDLEENEAGIRCIAVAIYDATGKVVAGVSLSSASVYLSEARMLDVLPEVRRAAAEISAELGFSV